MAGTGAALSIGLCAAIVAASEHEPRVLTLHVAASGGSPAEAFYVKCDGENNPPELRDTGEVVVEIGLAPLAPSEFIVVRIVRRAGATSDN